MTVSFSFFKQQTKTRLCYLTKLKLGEHQPYCQCFFSLPFLFANLITHHHTHLCACHLGSSLFSSMLCSLLLLPAFLYLVNLVRFAHLKSYWLSFKAHLLEEPLKSVLNNIPFPQYKHLFIHSNASSSSSVHSTWNDHIWPLNCI